MVTLQRLRDTFDSARRFSEWVVPAQTVCNYWNYMWTLLPEHLTERDSVGYTQRVTLISTPPGTLTFNLDLDGAGPVPSIKTTVPGEVETGISAASAVFF